MFEFGNRFVGPRTGTMRTARHDSGVTSSDPAGLHNNTLLEYFEYSLTEYNYIHLFYTISTEEQLTFNTKAWTTTVRQHRLVGPNAISIER